MEVQNSKLGPDHLDTLTSMYSLATWYSETARGAEALQLTEEVVELHKTKLGEDYPGTLDSERLLAHLCQGIEETSSTFHLGHGVPNPSFYGGFALEKVCSKAQIVASSKSLCCKVH